MKLLKGRFILKLGLKRLTKASWLLTPSQLMWCLNGKNMQRNRGFATSILLTCVPTKKVICSSAADTE